MPLLDLHVHSVTSDGGHDAVSIADGALKADVGLIAITDHDRLGESLRLPQLLPDRAVVGIEITTRTPLGFADLLAVGLRDPELVTTRLDPSHFFRRTIELLCQRLPLLGYEVPPLDVPEDGPSAVNWLLRQVVAYAPNHDRLAAEGLLDFHAFKQRYAWKGRELSFDAEFAEDPHAPTLSEMIACVRAAGGSTILAHPFIGPARHPDFERLLADFAAEGLDGIEVYHPSTTSAQRRAIRDMAARHGLLVSAGSDTHGHLELGRTSPRRVGRLIAAWRERLGLDPVR